MSEPSGREEAQAFDVASLCRNLSEMSPQPMLAVEGTTHIVRYLNPAFARLVGKAKEELIGRPFAQAVPEGEENGCIALFDRAFASGTPEVLGEQRHLQTPQMQTPPVFWSYSVWAIPGGNERPVGVMIQVTDSTEMAVFRAQTVGMNQQLLLSGTRQHELTEIAENAGRLKDEFLATSSHELRTPLTSILGWADTLANSNLDADTTRRAFEIIRRNAREQVRTVDDLLDTSRLITGKLALRVQAVSMNAVVASAVEGLRPAARARDIALEWEPDEANGQIAGDADRLQQVVWHLVSNALKFTPHGGRVAVRLVRLDCDLELSVSDTGIGIAPEFLPHVFDRFRQGDASSTRAFSGLGLGLSLVRQLVELHGGTVRAQSEGNGRGATFTASLPLLGENNRSEIAPTENSNEYPTNQNPA